MSTLVEIICSISQDRTQKIIEHFEQAGDRLFACCVYEELDRILLVIQVSPAADETELSTFLRFGRREGLIESYEYVTCYPVSAFLDPSLDLQEQMSSFPLRYGESWFPAIDHSHKVYICLDKPFMAFNQTTWLTKHQVRWEFEDIQTDLKLPRAPGDGH